MKNNSYDYIITGGGLSGLLLAFNLGNSSLLKNKTVAIIDSSFQDIPEKNFSFWSTKKPSILNKIPFRSWNAIAYSQESKIIKSPIAPYAYYTIKARDLFSFIMTQIEELPQFSLIAEQIEGINEVNNSVQTSGNTYNYNLFCFDSYFTPDQLNYGNTKPFIWQHFVGFEVEFEQDVVDENTVMYMDMRVSQPEHGLAFMYILPTSTKKAFFELTYFSKQLYSEQHYVKKLEEYLKENYESKFTLSNKEAGKIPMSSLKLQYQSGNRIPIGTKSGLIKASTGYSFLRNLHHAENLVNNLEKNSDYLDYLPKRKYTLYDDTLIQILEKGPLDGKAVFENLLSKNPIKRLFRFLDEETSFLEDLQLMNTVPKGPFMKAFFQQAFNSAD